jgi:hypothetical protein
MLGFEALEERSQRYGIGEEVEKANVNERIGVQAIH